MNLKPIAAACLLVLAVPSAMADDEYIEAERGDSEYLHQGEDLSHPDGGHHDWNSPLTDEVDANMDDVLFRQSIDDYLKKLDEEGDEETDNILERQYREELDRHGKDNFNADAFGDITAAEDYLKLAPRTDESPTFENNLDQATRYGISEPDLENLAEKRDAVESVKRKNTEDKEKRQSYFVEKRGTMQEILTKYKELKIKARRTYERNFKKYQRLIDELPTRTLPAEQKERKQEQYAERQQRAYEIFQRTIEKIRKQERKEIAKVQDDLKFYTGDPYYE